MRRPLAVMAVCVVMAAACAGSDEPRILERAPELPDAALHYLFYLHGRIIEVEGPDAVSPVFGRYEYHRILQAFAERGFVVVAEVREDGAGAAFVEDTAEQVRGLLAGGVPAGHIAVMGFSKGGFLTLGVSARVAHDGVGYAILAGCSGDSGWAEQLGPQLRGRFLSLFDSADRLSPSCKTLFAHAEHVREKTEHVFDSGLDHGHFYSPRKDWVDRVAAWAREGHASESP